MKRLLVVDDEADITTGIKGYLENYPELEIETANDPLQALSKFIPGKYDFVLMDIKMPRMNGFELCRRMKERDPQLPVYLITAFEIKSEEFQKVFPSKNIRGFLRKPFLPSELMKVIEAQMQCCTS